MWEAAKAVNPTIAFIGVRMSCDMLFRNSVLARLAYSAAASASESSLRDASFSRISFFVRIESRTRRKMIKPAMAQIVTTKAAI